MLQCARRECASPYGLACRYSLCRATHRFAMADLCELARNSVLISDFPPDAKRLWIGDSYAREDARRNDASKTNVPMIREDFRWKQLQSERDFIACCAATELALSGAMAAAAPEDRESSSSFSHLGEAETFAFDCQVDFGVAHAEERTSRLRTV